MLPSGAMETCWAMSDQPLVLSVILPHRHDGGETLVLRVVRAPRVMHVHRVDGAGERELFQQFDELLECELMKRFRHGWVPREVESGLEK